MLDGLERPAEVLRLRKQLFAVGQKNVAPDGRVACGDAGEVAKPRTGQRQEIAACRLTGHAIEVGERQQMRQMADRCKGGVVVLWRHPKNLGANDRPRVGGLLDQAGIGLRQWRQDDPSSVIQLRVGMLDSRDLLACDGVGGYEAWQALLEHAPCRIDHIPLGRSDIHQEHAGLDQVADCAEGGFAGRDRDRHQDDVRARHRQQRRVGSGIDDAQAARLLGRRWRLAVADDTLHATRTLERQGKRPAHESAADHTELVEHRGHASRRAAPRAACSPSGGREAARLRAWGVEFI